jgi:hypothetical protein
MDCPQYPIDHRFNRVRQQQVQIGFVDVHAVLSLIGSFRPVSIRF